jgi:hypothetical protein
MSPSENAQIAEVYRKCVVFLKNYADFFENDESISLNGEHIPEHSKSAKYSGIKAEGIRESSGERSTKEFAEHESVGGNSDISLPSGDLEVDDLELSEDEEPSEYMHNEYDKSEIQNNLPFVSLILFSEKGETMYCVKTESIFAEL